MLDNDKETVLPDWIGWAGQIVYETIISNPYKDQRLLAAFETLYSSPKLAPIWRKLNGVRGGVESTQHLVGVLIHSVECAPPKGQRATIDRQDEKKLIKEKQKRVDKFLVRIQTAANELSAALTELNENGGHMPADMYSGLALIESAMEYSPMGKACCLNQFLEFEKHLSSYDKARFPSPVMFVDTLALAVKNHPSHREIYSDNPWLSSSHSTWKDYWRVVNASLEDCQHMYGSAPHFSANEWVLLVHAFINEDIPERTILLAVQQISSENS